MQKKEINLFQIESVFEIDNMKRKDFEKYLSRSYLDNDFYDIVYDLYLMLNMIWKMLEENTEITNSFILMLFDEILPRITLLQFLVSNDCNNFKKYEEKKGVVVCK